MLLRLLRNATQAQFRLLLRLDIAIDNDRESAWLASGSPDSPKEFGDEWLEGRLAQGI